MTTYDDKMWNATKYVIEEKLKEVGNNGYECSRLCCYVVEQLVKRCSDFNENDAEKVFRQVLDYFLWSLPCLLRLNLSPGATLIDEDPLDCILPDGFISEPV